LSGKNQEKFLYPRDLKGWKIIFAPKYVIY